MEYATLGNTGLLVSKLCFGTMTFGDGRGIFKGISAVGQSGADELINASIDSGINFFDTADNYTEGESEKILGPMHTGLNEGPIVLMIENYRSGFLWRLMWQCPYLVRGLRRAAFSGGWLKG